MRGVDVRGRMGSLWQTVSMTMHDIGPIRYETFRRPYVSRQKRRHSDNRRLGWNPRMLRNIDAAVSSQPTQL